MVWRRVRRTHGATKAWLAGHCARRIDADSRANRQRQDAHGLPVVAEPVDVRAGPQGRGTLPRPLHLAAQGPRG